ncbi:hypothetical protein OIU76_001622 [Salix suchowensis]|nr:hypothetical protein OIU76_001622 [Salix suchowensis]
MIRRGSSVTVRWSNRVCDIGGCEAMDASSSPVLHPRNLTQSHSLHLYFHLHDTSPLPPDAEAFTFPHPFTLLAFPTPLPRFKSPPHRTHHFPVHSFSNDQQQQQPANQKLPNQQPRTLFPGGYKRPEIKVPNIVLQLDPEDVIRGGSEALGLIDKAVSKSVGIVVLNGSIGGGGSGKSLYEAACLVKSVVRDRAYLLIGERVDIATAVDASGVVLSDQGLPSIVARNMMMGSRTESVVLPLVARIVQTPNAALNASNSEGADFLIYALGPEERS